LRLTQLLVGCTKTNFHLNQNAILVYRHWYTDLARVGYFIDPLSNWFPLLQLINADKKKKLKKEALLIQEYYKLAKIVAFFYMILLEKKCPTPMI